MCEPMAPADFIRDVPFQVAAFVEKCTQPGSYERALGRSLYQSIRRDVEECVKRLDLEKKSR